MTPPAETSIAPRFPDGPAQESMVVGPHARQRIGHRSRRVPLRAALVATALLALLVASSLGEPASRYLEDPALAQLLRGIALVKGLIALGAIAAVWWRAAWSGSTVLAVAALAAVGAQVAGAIWIARLVAVPWAAGLFHAGIALLLACAWREHRAEGARQETEGDERNRGGEGTLPG